MSCDCFLIGLFIGPIRINHVIQNIMVDIYIYIYIYIYISSCDTKYHGGYIYIYIYIYISTMDIYIYPP